MKRKKIKKQNPRKQPKTKRTAQPALVPPVVIDFSDQIELHQDADAIADEVEQAEAEPAEIDADAEPPEEQNEL